MLRVEVRRTVPVVGEYDLLVAGGGMAGVGAAVAAGRRGARTLMVERLEQLGGLGSSGGVGSFSYHGGPPVAQGGVFEDIWDGLRACHALGAEHGFAPSSSEYFTNQPFDHTVLPLVLEELAQRAGVDLLYATDIVGARVEGGRIAEAILQNRSLDQAVRARVYVDGTGDGILARFAGARVLPLDEPAHPELIQPSQMLFLIRGAGGYELRLPEHDPEAGEPEPAYSMWPEPHRIALKLWMHQRTFDTGTGQGSTDAIIAFRRRIGRVLRAYRERGGRLEGTSAGGAAPDAGFSFGYAAPMLGLREGRRIEGEYVLTGTDVRSGRRFADSVCYGKSVLDSQRYREIVPPYQIPHRCFLARGVDNLYVAGRCFSAERLALSSARVMPTVSLMGQACGIGAALALRCGGAIRDVDPRRIREELVGSDSRPEEMRPFIDPDA